MGQKERTAMLYSFMYEIYRATASLMYLLQGMESVRSTELRPYDQLPQAEHQRAGSFAKLSYVDVPLTLAGASFDPHEVLDREGNAEQMAFKGWIEHIYNNVWEAEYRNRFSDGLEGDDLMRPGNRSDGRLAPYSGRSRSSQGHRIRTQYRTMHGAEVVRTWRPDRPRDAACLRFSEPHGVDEFDGRSHSRWAVCSLVAYPSRRRRAQKQSRAACLVPGSRGSGPSRQFGVLRHLAGVREWSIRQALEPCRPE